MKKLNQAFYLMDHRSIGPNRAITSFDYDYRFADEADKLCQANIATTSFESAQRITRKFQPFLTGKAVCTFKVKIDGDCTDGTYYSFIDNNEKEVINIETTDGYFVCCGHKLCETQKGDNKVKIQLDGDNKKYAISVNGCKPFDFEYSFSATELSGFVHGIKKGHIVSIYLYSLVMHVNFLVNENFSYCGFGAYPEDWTVTGNIVCGDPEKKNPCAFINAEAGKYYCAEKRFDEQTGVTGFESMILLPDGADGAFLEILSNGKTAFKIVSENGVFVTDSGEKLMSFTANVWQWIRVEADPVTQNAFVRIDTKNAGNHSLKFDAGSFDGIRIGIEAKQNTVMRFNDILVYNYDKPEDYCPEPKPLDTGEYVIGMNVCNLWREGSHTGWDAISALPDHEPYLGYYDEGIEETADWEIKFMLEHGIKFQHPCWYCQQWNISAPLYPKSFDTINRGLLSARYSDMMKFTFMWENTSGQIQNYEQFRDYIWPYWKEYYFSNPNILVIENKPVMTTYSIGLFVKGFGGIEGGKKALEFMREDIKTLGFDGLIMLFHDGHGRSRSLFQPLVDMGVDGIYGYHWNELGKDPEHQKKRMLTNRDELGMYVFPTLGMGFNNLGWGGHKHGVATLDDFKTAAEWLKSDFLPGYGDSWKAKYFFVATWNEFGEGHFVTPSALHGFGYLDTVAEVFGDEPFDYSLNIKPDENQKKRLGHLYVQSRSIIKPLREVDERTKHIPSDVVVKWDMSDKKSASLFIPSNDIHNYSTDGGVIHGTRCGGSGDIVLRISNLSLNLDNIDYLHIRMRSVNENNSMMLAYMVGEKTGSVNFAYFNYKKSEDYNDFYVPKSLFTIKEGIITDIDLCPMRLGWGDFDIALIEFLKYREDERPCEVYVNGEKQYFDYEPENRNDDIYVAVNPQRGFFKKLNVVYETSRKNGTIRLITKQNDIMLTYGLDHFTVNGKSFTLPEKLAVKDGLPVLPLGYMSELFGYSYKFTDKILNISVSE